MSTVFSKNKEKRSRSSSNEANNSFVKNVTSRVSGLLPATIAKWFSSPSSSKPNGSSAPPADGTDSSTEDEAPESPIPTQPPSKRMRFSSPGKYNHFGTAEPDCVPTNIDTIEQCTSYSAIKSPPGRATFRRETNFASTPVRAPNEETVIERSERDSTMPKPQHTVANVGPSVASKRKSLFGFPENDELSMLALRKTASSQRILNDDRPTFNPMVYSSPFYSGRTTYGGASTYIDQPNIKQRKKAVVQEAVSNDNYAMSQSARRIMDLLENYSSPVKEAKRMSQFIKTSSNDTLDGSTISGSPYVNKVMSYKTQELHVPNIATLLRLKQRSRLMDTTNAARQILASHSSSMPDYGTQPYPAMNTQKEQPEKEASSKFTTKVKTRVTRQPRGEKIETEEPITTVNLPTAVLQIDKDNLPKFTFGISQVSNPKPNPTPDFLVTSTPISTSHAPASNSITQDTVLSKPETISSNDSYKFSSPVRISDSHKISTTPPKFTFGCPERGIEKHKTGKKKDDDSSIVVGTPKQTGKLPIPNSKDWQCPDCWVKNKPDAQKCVCCGAQQSVPKPKGWQCPDCWVNNKIDDQKCVCCGAKQPTKESAKPSKCIICKLANSQTNSEKCVNCEKIQLNNNTTTLTALKPVESSNWKCEDCWVSNDVKLDKCACCGGKNPTKTASIPSSTANVVSDWQCNDCWIKNKPTMNKCAACGGAKPGAKQPAPPTSTITSDDSGLTLFGLRDTNMKNVVKSQSDKWECTSCLVRNENNRTKCVCCESDKPGLIKESAKKSFNFGITPNPTFKFGIDQKAQETTATKTPVVKVSESLFKPQESETNNNVLPKTPTFSFGIPAKKIADQTDTTKDSKISETPKHGFTFGIPKEQSKTEVTVTPVFGSTTKLTESVQETPSAPKEKSEEVPRVDYKFPVIKETPLGGMFGSSAKPQESKEKPRSPSAPLTIPATTEKAQTGAAMNLLPKATSEAAPKTTFTFSGIGMKPATNLFAAPASTNSSFSSTAQSTPSSMPVVPLFQMPEATTASPVSMFQKPDATASPSVALFQKSESSASVAPPALAATTPVFSFGSNVAQSAPPPQSNFGGNTAQSATPAQSEKPKFNFTFGNAPPLFNNNSFNTSTDNNANKFSITGNNLGGGSGLSAANPLTGGNTLTPSKLGGSNELTANALNASSEMPARPTLFGAPAQKENMWSARNSNSNNMFVTSTSTNMLQKPAAFTFGSTTSFNSNATPAFGSNPSPAPTMFGMNQSASAQPSMFGSPAQSQPAPTMFGASQPASTPAPAMNLFGSPSVGPTPTFGAPNPTFEAQPINPAPAQAFNFGGQPTSGIFGFGQQSQQQQQQQQQPQMQQMPQQAGVYSFGGGAGGQMQFNMGSVPSSTGVRRVRKAVRRNPQR